MRTVFRGARDHSSPDEVMACVVPGAVRFAGDFDVWGSGGGTAFFSPVSGYSCVVRAPRIGACQLVDLVVQENGMCPHLEVGLADSVLDELEPVFAVSGGSAVSPSGLQLKLSCLPEGSVYERVHVLPGLVPGGSSLSVGVLAGSTVLPADPPPPEYVAVMRDGLARSCGLPEAAADRHLRGCLLNA